MTPRLTHNRWPPTKLPCGRIGSRVLLRSARTRYLLCVIWPCLDIPCWESCHCRQAIMRAGDDSVPSAYSLLPATSGGLSQSVLCSWCFVRVSCRCVLWILSLAFPVSKWQEKRMIAEQKKLFRAAYVIQVRLKSAVFGVSDRSASSLVLELFTCPISCIA